METGNCFGSSLIPDRPERKVIEKNRRNQMKFLYSQLFSLLPENVNFKGCPQMSDRLNEAIRYIETLKENLEKTKNKKEKDGASTSQSFDIQIHEISSDIDVVLIFGLKTYSCYCDIIRTIDQYSTAVGYASFSTSGPSTFHVHQKKIEAAEMYRRLNELFEGFSKKEVVLDVLAPTCNEEESNLDLWDFEISSDIWCRNS
ncbi:transcription factor bHLH162 [Lactuca sativa]|uniref:transcription factor bHLH162 n=1 Tax=Lactuca sativa TaxID=4236 RepID=UPI001C69159C|nr:transcription factor bHLH162 [Lactuca sativa]